MNNDKDPFKPNWENVFFDAGLFLLFFGLMTLAMTVTKSMSIWCIIFGVIYMIISFVMFVKNEKDG